MTLKKGDKAPEFKLVDSDKKEVTLAQFAGKNLIMHFFPAAFTGVCTTQLCTVRDAISSVVTTLTSLPLGGSLMRQSVVGTLINPNRV